MAKTVADAMQRAADRARRSVELENAKIIIERTLGYEIDAAQWPWLFVLSHVLKHICLAYMQSSCFYVQYVYDPTMEWS